MSRVSYMPKKILFGERGESLWKNTISPRFLYTMELGVVRNRWNHSVALFLSSNSASLSWKLETPFKIPQVMDIGQNS